MQLEPPPYKHTDPCTHVDTPGRVFNARSDVFTFIPRYMHTHMPHTTHPVYTHWVLGACT